MEPAFEDLRDGSRIRVVRPSGEYVGVLHVAHQPAANRFGIIIQFGPANMTGDSLPDVVSDQAFVATGHCGLPIHRLTLEELRSIERTGDPQVPFALTVSVP